MSRATRYFVLCAVLLAVTFAALDLYFAHYPGDYGPVFVVALLFLLPGRISNHFLKDLYRSRRLLDQERFPEAIDSGESFLKVLAAEPWRRKLIYLTWSLYSWNVEAMARNNIGASLMMMGQFDLARHELLAALTADPNYALPYANLAAIEAAEGNHEERERLVSIAEKNGYSGAKAEQLADKVMALYAKLQS